MRRTESTTGFARLRRVAIAIFQIAALFVCLLQFSPGLLAQTSEPDNSLPFYMGEELRYQNSNIFARTMYSTVGSLANVAYWDQRDWWAAGLTAAGTLLLMAPTSPSPDVRFQDWVLDGRNPVLDTLLPRLTSERFIYFGAGLIGSTALAGWAFDSPELSELASLALESLAVAQFLHVSQKLLIGREGPAQGDGQGIIYGPSRSWEFFPSGTPSGHTASLFAITALVVDYADNIYIDMLGYFCYVYIGVSVIYNNQHFISDVVWGAPFGYAVGKWVARHRSSKYKYKNGAPVRKTGIRLSGAMPWIDDATGAGGFSLLWSW